MVLRIDVVCAALEAVFGVDAAVTVARARVVELTPKGRQLDDALAAELRRPRLVLLCGRYEGIDERVSNLVTDRVSIGPYVLTGGEVAAMAVLDAVDAQAARRDRQPGERDLESHSAGARRRGRVPALHAAGGVPRLGRAGRPAQRRITARSRAGARVQRTKEIS